MQNGTAALESSLVFSYKTEQAIIILSSKWVSNDPSQEMKTYVQRETYARTCSSFIRNNQKETRSAGKQTGASKLWNTCQQ